MDLSISFHYLNLTLEVFFLDLLLSGDNAIVIALACRSLPPTQMRRAMLIGTSGAIILRIILTSVASILLNIPLLKIIGGIMLIIIAIKLVVDENETVHSNDDSKEQPKDLISAVFTVLIADLIMSVDNVVGLAAVTQGNFIFLALGLLISIPLLMFGSLFITQLLQRYPLLIQGGGAMLGWFAGDIAISDPLIVDWVNQQAPMLIIVVPILTAIFVLIESRIMLVAKINSAALRPKIKHKTVNIYPTLRLPKPSLVSNNVFENTISAIEATPVKIAPNELDKLTKNNNYASAAPTDKLINSGFIPNKISFSFSFIGYSIVCFALLAMGWFGFSDIRSRGISKPIELNQYICPGIETSIYYRHGFNTIRMSSASKSISGVMDYDKIDWGDYKKSTNMLGLQPPIEIKYSDNKLIQLSGGYFDGINCLKKIE